MDNKITINNNNMVENVIILLKFCLKFINAARDALKIKKKFKKNKNGIYKLLNILAIQTQILV